MSHAERQHGLITRVQALGCGLSLRQIRYRVVRGWLRPVHRGVYAVGPALSSKAREMAAVLACGPGAALAARSAASLWRWLPRQPATALVDVAVERNCGRRPGIGPHVFKLESDEVTVLDGVPITTPGRTILDLAAVATARELEQALAVAVRRGLVTPTELAALIARYPRRAGSGVLRRMVGNTGALAETASPAEDLMLALVDEGGLPRPESNVQVAGHKVDFHWRAERVVVEVDGFAFHSSRKEFEQDRLRDADLATRDYRVMRVTWRQLAKEPTAVLVRLAQTLAVARARA